MIVLAWVGIVALAVLICFSVGLWISEDPDGFFTLLICAFVLFAVVFGIWGFGYVAHWWGPMW